MEVEYELTRDDLFAFQWRAAYRSPVTRRARRKVYLYLFLTLLAISVLPAIGADGFALARVNYVFLAVAFPVVALLTWRFDKQATRRAILELLEEEKPGRGQVGRHKVSLTATEVVEATEVGEQRVAWGGVDRVEQNEEYIFIYTQPHAAHIIPKRAFADARAAESFYQLARMSREAAA